jgi:hypothetical protein
MKIIVELQTQTGKTVKERIKAKSLEMAEKMAELKNKGCTVLDSYEDRKQSRKSMMKDCW